VGHARRALLLLVLYATLVAWLTWPLAAHLTSHLPNTQPACNFDTLHMAWALAWQSRALVSAPTTLPDANIYHPTPHALYYGETGFGALPYFLPVFLATVTRRSRSTSPSSPA
jgi:4-amino-4-deoxy-L-arabinose transferase-like glycosyltransferase